MAYPSNNLTRIVEGSPVGATALNTEIYNQFVEGYWLTDIKFMDANKAVLLFVKLDVAIVLGGGQQKVKEVAANQAAVDADAATELADGNYQTGIFPSPSGVLFIAYSQLDTAPML